MDVCLRILKESNKSKFDSYSASVTVYWSYSILPSGIVESIIFSTTPFEIAEKIQNKCN